MQNRHIMNKRSSEVIKSYTCWILCMNSYVSENSEFLEQSAPWHPGYLWQAHSPSSIWELLHSICCTESYRKSVLALHHFLSGGAFLHSFFLCFFPFHFFSIASPKGMPSKRNFVRHQRNFCHICPRDDSRTGKKDMPPAPGVLTGCGKTWVQLARKNQLKLIIVLFFPPLLKKGSFTSLERRHTKSSVKSCSVNCRAFCLSV